MAKNKLTKDDKRQLAYLIADFIYKKEGLKDLNDERKKIKEKFLDDIEKIYHSVFNLDKTLIDFAKKYGIQHQVTLHMDRDYREKEDIYGTFSPNNSYDWDYFVKDNSYYENSGKYLPYFGTLCYQSVDIGNHKNTNFSHFIGMKYKEVLRNNLYQTNERSKIAHKIYLDFKAILDLCNTDVDVNEHFQIPEITEYFEKRFGKKLSTELSTVNKEKIDFIKNYLKQVDNE